MEFARDYFMTVVAFIIAILAAILLAVTFFGCTLAQQYVQRDGVHLVLWSRDWPPEHRAMPPFPSAWEKR